MKTSLHDLRFDNSYARLPRAFFSHVQPRGLIEPRLLAFDAESAKLLGLSADSKSAPDFLPWVSGNLELPGMQPLAMVYAGHQFGVFVPQLGDGRAILLGEVLGPDGERWDVQMKGAGVTPYSRNGDGRAVWRSVIREYLASQAMRGLGIPTTHALSIAASDEVVLRETPERAAVLTRVARSHLRFGTFEYFFYQRREAELRALCAYTLERHFRYLTTQEEPYAAMFYEICERTAELIARWTAVGFQHGVMNTDNMSIAGDTLDYGPYGFMDQYDPSWICNHSDHVGRYAFAQQPGVGLWNLGRLAIALTPLVAEEALMPGLEMYRSHVAARHLALMREKLGLQSIQTDDASLLNALFTLMHANSVDYTLFFRALGGCVASRSEPAVREMFADRDGFQVWWHNYQQRLAIEQGSGDDRSARMNAVNPKFVLRNHIAQQAIEQADQGDFSEISKLSEALSDPYRDVAETDRYASLPPEWARHLEISCSS